MEDENISNDSKLRGLKTSDGYKLLIINGPTGGQGGITSDGFD